MEHDDRRETETRRPYEPPRIDEEHPIECVAQACTGATPACNVKKKGGGGGVQYTV